MNVMLRSMFYRLLGSVAGLSSVLALIFVLLAAKELFFLLAQGAISPGWFLLAMGALLPARSDSVFLFAVSVAIIHGYIKWDRSNEIVSLRMAGLSDRALALPGLGAAALGAVLTALLSLYVSPVSERTFRDIVYDADFDLSLALLDEGYPQRIAPNLSISFHRRLAADDLEGVTILDGRKPDRFTYIVAEEAHLIRHPGTDQERVLILQRGNYQERRESEEKATPVDFDEMTLPISESADGSSRVRTWHGSYEQTIGEVFHPPPEVRADPREYAAWITDGHHRIVLPLQCLSYAVFALGGMLTAGYQHRSATMLRACAVAAGIAFWHGSLISAHPLLATTPALMPAFYFLAAVPGAAGALLLLSKELGAGRRAGRIPRRPSAIGTADAEAGVG